MCMLQACIKLPAFYAGMNKSLPDLYRLAWAANLHSHGGKKRLLRMLQPVYQAQLRMQGRQGHQTRAQNTTQGMSS